ncbi:MAG: zinc-ribbon domain-containing protein [Thaumarchaeota archaeon]|nr:zinc-ribbon domain-containing protein [Candidatus Calditenuaceae archaeon]MDW8186786.1 hypothetical protein [Nitrososphaerota archaeon]
MILRNYQCPNCGALHEVREGDVSIRCGYCGVTFRTYEDERRFIVPVYYDSSRAIENFLLWAKKQLGYEETLPMEISLKEVKLHFYPFWVATVHASTTFTGLGEDAEYSSPHSGGFREIRTVLREESGSFERLIKVALPAHDEIPLKGEMISVSRARVYFSHDYVKGHGGVLHGATLRREEAMRTAEGIATDELTKLISREVVKVTSRNDRISVGELSLVYVPVWYVTYGFRGKSYFALIDASSSRVIFATYPSDPVERAAYLGVSVAHLIAGIGIALLIWSASWLGAATVVIGMASASAVYAYRGLSSTKARESVTEDKSRDRWFQRIARISRSTCVEFSTCSLVSNSYIKDQ